MTAASTLTLPGVAFEAISPPLDESLPRMDVCAFVGFASSGPFHVPVAVEDIDHFRGVFGPDPVLAYSRADGVVWRARLGGAVDAFFANGGQRAWVIRVGDDGPGGATANQFVVPHLLVPGHDGGDWKLATVQARCSGSWSDQLRAGASLRISSAPGLDADESGVVVHAAVNVVPGDLLRLDFGADHEGWVIVEETTLLPEGLRVTFESGIGWLVAPADVTTLVHAAVMRVGVDGFEMPAVGNSPSELELTTDDEDGIVKLFADPESDVRVGDVMAVVDSDGLDGSVVLIEVGEEHSSPSGSPPDDRRRFTVASARNVNAISGPVSLPEDCVVEVVRIDLQAWRGSGLHANIGDLGLALGHPRFLGSLPSDESLFSLVADLPRYGNQQEDGETQEASDFTPASLTGLEADSLEPRFPFAGPGRDTPVFLPLGMSTVPKAENAGSSPLDADSATSLERDGLAEFGAGLFVDADLAGLGTDTLLASGFNKAYLARDARRLHGIHAVLALDEVTLLVVPDAGHTGWEKTVVHPFQPLGASVLDRPIVGDGDVVLWWSAVPGATGYEIEQDTSPGFDNLPAASFTEDVTLLVELEPRCPALLHFRVRATRDEEVGPWSNARSATVPERAFIECDPVPSFPDDASPPEDPVDLSTVIAPEAPGPVTAWMCRDPVPGPSPDLEAVHAAMIRLCAARADVVAILSLPRHFRTSDAIAHLSRLVGDDAGSLTLAADVLPLSRDVSGIFSYAALYHPWVVTGAASDDTPPPVIPPDGPMAGIYAARALARGAWIAPANVPITGALALEPRTTDTDRRRAITAGINPIAPDPQGFVAVGADTLSREAALRPVNVRRLMILLRRLAIREGNTYVFHNNDAGFRRLVKMRFEALLYDLYRRGAFVGSTPEEAFQVATGDDVNPPASVDLGRFVIEIRVAPSQPMKFITVRLVLTGQDVTAFIEQ